MEDTYLVEIRLARTKWRIRDRIVSIARSFQLEEFMERHPHVTLFGPFTLRPGTTGRDLLAAIGTIAMNFDPVTFVIDGWEKREGMHGSVIAFSVRPSDELRSLTAGLSAALTPIVESMNAWDGQPDQKWFHVTIANRLEAEAAFRAFASLNGNPAGVQKPEPPGPSFFTTLRNLFTATTHEPHPPVIHPPLLDEAGLRITVMQNEHILAEYDLLEKRWVMTGHDHESLSWKKTLLHYRLAAGFEMRDPAPAGPEAVFVISDLHLGHANIIRYCSRPFLPSDPDEMDHVLLKNWNYSVGRGDTVFHLGDFRYGRDTPPAGRYQKKLHGQITLVAGNHDTPGSGAVPSVIIRYEGIEFLLIHDPAEAPPGFTGWVIHGHHHNNDLRHYPFINMRERRVNVSAEVLGYCPVSLAEIARIIREREESGDPAPVLLRYPVPVVIPEN